MKTLCIYHANCDDGFAAAWCVRSALGSDVEFYGGVYEQPPPDVTGRDVLMVDFSYKRPVLEAMAKSARSILILDHHKTAAEDLKAFGLGPKPNRTLKEWQNLAAVRDASDYRGLCAADSCSIASLFDIGRSGAGIAWDFFHPDASRPLFIDYIEDRDLWRKSLLHGDEFTIALRSYPQDFAVWDQLAGQVPELINEGKSLQRYYRLRVDELKRSAYIATIAGDPMFAEVDNSLPQHRIRIANAPHFAASEVAGELATDDVEFGASYFEVRAGEWQYSLRSRTDFDVSAIARLYGGGGHRAAAGFSVSAPVHRWVGA